MWKIFTIAAICLTACASAPQSAGTAGPSSEQTDAQKFESWKADFMARAIAKGYRAELVTGVIGRAEFSPRAVASNDSQPEFSKPIWAYVKATASASRLNSGRAKLAENTALFDRLERDYGVDREILTAIWGLESSFGAILGDYQAVNALASFAYSGRRQAFGEKQLFAILDLLTDGQVRYAQLKSSWAGAMGMTQFIPATFRDYAVDYDGNGNKDLWTDKGDALASAANYMSRSGWQRGEPVFAEVKLPANFDYAQADGRKKFLQEWASMGIAPIQGGGFTPAGNMLNAKLYIPAGAKGPALLTFKNFDVIKKYNNSNSYAMGIQNLAMGFGGKQAIASPWPEGDKALSLSHKKKLQEALTRQGFDTGGVDGLIGPNSQKAIRNWQIANNVTADGYVEARLYARIVSAAGMEP